jgi:hypothetical protein
MMRHARRWLALRRRGWMADDVLVQGRPHASRRLAAGAAVYFLLGLGAVFGLIWLGGTPLGAVAALVAGHIVGRCATARLRAASAYRIGWLQGRTAMVGALTEAMRRDMHPVDWLRAEAERDAAILGMKLPSGGDADG